MRTKVLIAVLLGFTAGSFFPEAGPYFKKGADLFLHLINMIVVLLVVSTVTLGIVRFGTPKNLLRVARQSILLFLLFTFSAILIGMAVGALLGVGSGLRLTAAVDPSLEIPSVSAMILSWIPTNPLASLANGNIIQILVFSTFLGISINAAGPKGRPIADCLESVYGAMEQITNIVLKLAPLGVFATVAYAAGIIQLSDWSLAALYFLGAYFLGAILLIAGPYYLALRWFWNIELKKLIFGMRDALVVALATCSSTATLPVTMQCLVKNLGVSRDIAGFVAPMGATLNMNGLALFHGLGAMFAAQAYGISLGWEGTLAILASAMLSAIGTGGIPGAGLIQLYAVFNSVGLPVEGIAVIAVFETVREMASSMLNVLGDAVTAVAVAESTGEMDRNENSNHGWETSII